jgi:hypothetical protein
MRSCATHGHERRYLVLSSLAGSQHVNKCGGSVALEESASSVKNKV